MKKKILALNILALSVPLSAQVLTTVADQAYMTVLPGTLVYNGGGLDVNDRGILDISGNVQIEGSSTDTFRTRNSGTVTGVNNLGNIILRLTAADNSTYGQLSITGLSNANVTGTVYKEFRNAKHGTYQQIALPFNGKPLSELSTELGKTFTDARWTQNEILKWNNTRERSDNFPVSSSTLPLATDYVMLGSLGLDVSTNPKNTGNIQVPNLSTLTFTPGTYVIKGRAVGDDVNTVRLYGGGLDLNYGTQGENVNIYRETYNSYLQDVFVSGGWTADNFGKNLYQFGNPYFTNLDLSNIGIAETSTPNDGMVIPNIQGIRFDPGTVTSDSSGATISTGAKYITFTANGPAVGDVDKTMVKPMQTFVIKLTSAANDVSNDLKFNNLRRFSYTARNGSTPYSVSAAKGANSSTVKQLGVIALDAQGNELGRTYYVVYAGAETGSPALDNATAQVTAPSTNTIGTFEEDAINGGIDANAASKYWLYINQADEDTFKGKAVAMNLYSNDIKSLKFELREDAKLVTDNASYLSSGKEFYIQKKGTSDFISIKQNAILPVDGEQYSLFYDKGTTTLGSNDVKLSRTKIAFDRSSDKYVLIFDPKWKQADVNVYEASGKLIFSKAKVSTANMMPIELKNLNGVYVVTATSEKGEVFNGKIIK
ncbi:T9SS type A sorting domain-containing protein [Soonwooa sp.]|uniref:T9SS type A sorting domain-containing protein n=1 Tax=Soonwooa sp. TaxID=1938592 RepID=UPI002608A807|nr:T9SS type A sorting domain-containing protein [Soonwooa sp.]